MKERQEMKEEGIEMNEEEREGTKKDFDCLHPKFVKKGV